jgi:hypothetical protein
MECGGLGDDSADEGGGVICFAVVVNPDRAIIVPIPSQG